MKKTTILMMAMLACASYSFSTIFIGSRVQARKLAQDEVKELEVTTHESFTIWKEKHAQQVGTKLPYTAVTLVAKRTGKSEAIIRVSINSNNQKVIDASPDVEITVQPVENDADNGIEKNAGIATQAKMLRTNSNNLGVKGQIAMSIPVAIQENASALKVTTRLRGSSLDRTFSSTIFMGDRPGYCTVGASPPPDSDISQFVPTEKLTEGKIANALVATNLTTALQCRCDTFTVSCSCTGCAGCTTSKACRAFPCGTTISTTCNPMLGTCSITCTSC